MIWLISLELDTVFKPNFKGPNHNKNCEMIMKGNQMSKYSCVPLPVQLEALI